MELKKCQLVTQPESEWLIGLYNVFRFELLGLTTLIASKLMKYKNAQLSPTLIVENHNTTTILWFAINKRKKEKSYCIFGLKCQRIIAAH